MQRGKKNDWSETVLTEEQIAASYERERQRRQEILRKRRQQQQKKSRARHQLPHQTVSLHRDVHEPSIWVETYIDENGKTKRHLHKPPPPRMTPLQRLGLASCTSNRRTDPLSRDAHAKHLRDKDRRIKENRMRQEQERYMYRMQHSLADVDSGEEGEVFLFQDVIRIEDAKRVAHWVTVQETQDFNLECASGSAMPPREDEKEGELALLPTVNTANSLLCCLCAKETKTHMASPCLHFAFCKACVSRLNRQGVTSCPICNIPNVTYTRVNLSRHSQSVIT